jgi:KDO2-lipid IV(A) lauroyltransferase
VNALAARDDVRGRQGRALRLVARAVALLSWGALARAGAALGWLAGSVLRIRRAAVERAMIRAGVADPKRQARAMYAGLGAGVFELFWLAAAAPELRDETLRTHVVLDDDLDVALFEAAQRGPVVLAASHTANWELLAYGAAQVLARRGQKLAVVVKPQSVGAFDAFCTQLRRTCGLELIAPSGAFDEAKRRLAAGAIVAMPIDQVPERKRHGVSVPFLGAAALADRAPAALARATGATLLVVAASRDGRVQRGHLLAELPPHARGESTASAWIEHATREATRVLEAFVRSKPASWLWLHRRWRAPLELGAGRARGTAGEPARGARGKSAAAGSLVVKGYPG